MHNILQNNLIRKEHYNFREVTGQGLEDRGIEIRFPAKGKICLSSKASRLTLELTQSVEQ
jgi:hypothetical protein